MGTVYADQQVSAVAAMQRDRDMEEYGTPSAQKLL
jgi:hypothetical protein